MKLTRLIVLGLLIEKPYHGYELKQTMKERYMAEWTNIAFGSIYFALRQMAQEELISLEGTEQAGNRPARSVYAITEAGRGRFLELLREGWQSDNSSIEVTRACILFMQHLPRQEVLGYLKDRIRTIDRRIEHILEVLDDVSSHGAPWTAEYVCRYDIGLFDKDRQWTTSLIEDIETGLVVW